MFFNKSSSNQKNPCHQIRSEQFCDAEFFWEFQNKILNKYLEYLQILVKAKFQCLVLF